jgi:hypothetical protein
MPQQVGKFDFAGIPAAGQQPAGQQPAQTPQQVPFDFSGLQRQAPPQMPSAYQMATAIPGSPAQTFAILAEILKGGLKGAGETAVNLGSLVHKIPGVSGAVDALYGTHGVSQAAFGADSPVRQDLKAANTAQSVGKGIEQAAEFMIPAGGAQRVATTVASHLPKYTRLLPHMAAQGATSAAVTTAQGGDPTKAAITGAVAPAVVRGAMGTARAIGNTAEPLVRAAIKPTVTAMRQVSGASGARLDAKAAQLVKFIVENKVTTADKARAIFDEAEKELQRVLTAKNATTDAATRAQRYLESLERSASRQGLAADDVATVRNAMAELLEGNMGKDVVKMVPTPHATLVDQYGKPLTVLTPQTSRALRTDITATEALDSARASGQWSTKKQWGEQKGAQTEATKTVERAQRDAVKAAVPEAKPLLQREGHAIQARDVLDRMAFRQGNRDAVSLPAHVMAAGEIASGRVPLLAYASNWLRNNGLKAGIYAADLRKAVDSGNAQQAARILERIGVALPPALAGGR